MKSFCTGLLVLGILAGMFQRTLQIDPCDSGDRVQLSQEVHDCQGHHDHEDHQHPGDDPHDQNCPPDHHHHNGVCHHGCMPLVVDSSSRVSLHELSYSRSLVSLENVPVPDEPVEEFDKPPLI